MPLKEELAIKIGAHITKHRLAKGLTGAELARRVEIEKTNLHRIEKGQTSVTVFLLSKICDALEINLNDFFSEFNY